ncbi:hypothetical protein [Saccharopolyspora sp. 7B]|uniref:hypothetical protein n=1 Tax=Saccharopolyspora sp. 7B TaxID=2877240 RepID=UPI002104C868|nr:hypothetical protein [Saccharopolyspora sp. 7B]
MASTFGAGNATSPPGCGWPYSASNRAANVRPAATLTCWPSTVDTAPSNPSAQPTTRSPGRAATNGSSSGSAASTASIRATSASNPSQCRTSAATSSSAPPASPDTAT